MRSLRLASCGVLCYVYGSMLFWFPDALYHYLRGGDLRGFDFLILTLVLPGIVAAGWLLLLPRARGLINGLLISGFMMFGILTTGPLWMTISATFAGGGFASGSMTWEKLGILTLLFPLADIDFSTYDGTLFALGSCIIGLLMLGITANVSRGTQPGTGSASPNMAH